MCRACGCAIEETTSARCSSAASGAPRRRSTGTRRSTSGRRTRCRRTRRGPDRAEFLEAKKRPETLKTFVNTTLGETWKERGEAPDWELLHQRRERLRDRHGARGAIVLTAASTSRRIGCVRGRRVGAEQESWSIDAGEIDGDTALEATWAAARRAARAHVPGRRRRRAHDRDAGDRLRLQHADVYNWARRIRCRA
jgi:phage terminase large subunit GpA-like protein